MKFWQLIRKRGSLRSHVDTRELKMILGNFITAFSQFILSLVQTLQMGYIVPQEIAPKQKEDSNIQ